MLFLSDVVKLASRDSVGSCLSDSVGSDATGMLAKRWPLCPFSCDSAELSARRLPRDSEHHPVLLVLVLTQTALSNLLTTTHCLPLAVGITPCSRAPRVYCGHSVSRADWLLTSLKITLAGVKKGQTKVSVAAAPTTHRRCQRDS